MTSVQGRGCFYRESLFITLINFSLLPKLDDKLFNQSTDFSDSNFLITKPYIFNYIKEDLQQILKTVIETWAPTFKKFQEKFLKA